MKDIFNKLTEYGSGFTIDAERVYDEEGTPMIYHLRMYGLIYPNDYEIIGYDLEELMGRAIEDGERFIRKNKKKLS